MKIEQGGIGHHATAMIPLVMESWSKKCRLSISPLDEMWLLTFSDGPYIRRSIFVATDIIGCVKYFCNGEKKCFKILKSEISFSF